MRQGYTQDERHSLHRLAAAAGLPIGALGDLLNQAMHATDEQLDGWRPPALPTPTDRLRVAIIDAEKRRRSADPNPV